MKKSLECLRADINNEKWENMIHREKNLYSRTGDIRSEFERDYTRILHCNAYRRLKNKTQVFFSPKNDHICTRLEHVSNVESVSYTIANYLGLNTELTKAIAISHDIGHSPFGHQGERILSDISKRDIGCSFWHEKNGLEMVDKIELLETPKGNLQNLNLTYAVRDGIISHCGEIDENGLKPRNEFINLDTYTYPNEYAPYTWEGCVVKISDKISYLGRDIIDAITFGILDEDLKPLNEILNVAPNKVINNTTIINDLVSDLCENSSIENGLCFSPDMYQLIKKLKKYNYENIYLYEKLQKAEEYFKLIINAIYDLLRENYTNKEKATKICPDLIRDFNDFIKNYWNLERFKINENDRIFNIENEKDYCRAIIYYISGMTDNYAIESYNKIIGF